ncbi:unnamed protein product [Ascophyllum nodosum]
MSTVSSPKTCGDVAVRPPQPLPPRAPVPSAIRQSDSRGTSKPIVARREIFEDLTIHNCSMMGGIRKGMRARQGWSRVVKSWEDEKTCGDDEVERPKQGGGTLRPRQRPSLPPEARRSPRRVGGKKNETGLSLLAVCGSQVDSSPTKGCLARGAEAAAARWEKRYNKQVSATKEALLAKRNAEISLREAERLLHEVRAEATSAAREVVTPKDELAIIMEASSHERGHGEEGTAMGVKQMLDTKTIHSKIETDLRRRLREVQGRLTQSEEEGTKLRQALETARGDRALQPVVACLGRVVNECLASLGLVRGVPDAEFHERLSALRERAQEAGRGFLSIKGLHAAAEGARALDASRSLRQQLQEVQLDANRQRARRIEAEARLMEKEEGARARKASTANDREETIKELSSAEELRARVAAADDEIRRLHEALTERDKVAAAEGRRKTAPMADVRSIFEEGHRYLELKMKIKAHQVQKEVARIHEELEARLRELRNEGARSPTRQRLRMKNK